MLGRALARIMFFRETKSYDAALLEIDNAGRSLLGLNTETIERLPADGLKDVLGSDPALLMSRLYTAGVLLKEKAEIFDLMEGERDSVPLYLKALRLMTENIEGIEELDGEKAITNVDAAVEKLKEYELPDDLERRLVSYFEHTGRYDRSEDLIFEMIERDPAFVDEGISFYERLLAKSDSDLQNGRLPRNEVEDALNELRQKVPGLKK